MSNSVLLEKLEASLPKDVTFKCYYLSTLPTSVSSLYSKFPEQQDSKTSCTKHFLVLAVNPALDKDKEEHSEVIIYAIEIFIYSSAHNVIIFVSKVDTTGYLDTLKLPKNVPSPIRTVSAIFLQYLVAKYQQPGHNTIISLFARAQDQYLFPRSVEYSGKHVQHDSGLIRWWCRVLNPILVTSQAENRRGYIIIPGLNTHETLSYVPNKVDNLWTVGHPLLEITTLKGTVAPRYLIPHFPDDPKARFLDELDEELVKGGSSNGYWRSIKTLDQFWEMMAFRQECSAGRLVGFIWIVISPNQEYIQSKHVNNSSETSRIVNTDKQDLKNSSKSKPICHSSPITKSQVSSPTLIYQTDHEGMSRQVGLNHETDSSATMKILRQPHKRKAKLTGRIIPRQPRYKLQDSVSSLLGCNQTKQKIRYHKPHQDSGQIIVDEADYHRIMELLLRLDFSNLERAISSSSRWIREARCTGCGRMKEPWGQTVIGKKVDAYPNAPKMVMNILEPRLLQKRRKIPSIKETLVQNER
ncbi:Histone acetyltransferase [Erysiphe neolycopersici]|uniref:histone acetyltransferase n=1 Tax=Erysiphe neolycopersici TaxID=212602 RepID=A0A420HCD7_9PEZI|nr:Histone acetyltransferase [Erysiphe neolycopersici]